MRGSFLSLKCLTMELKYTLFLTLEMKTAGRFMVIFHLVDIIETNKKLHTDSLSNYSRKEVAGI